MASSFHGSALNPIKAGANNVMNYSSAVMTPRVNQSQVQDKTETSPQKALNHQRYSSVNPSLQQSLYIEKQKQEIETPTGLKA